VRLCVCVRECVCACMSVCESVCACRCVCVRACTYMYVCTCVCACSCAYACEGHVWVHWCVYIMCLYIKMSRSMSMTLHVFECMNTCLCVCMYIVTDIIETCHTFLFQVRHLTPTNATCCISCVYHVTSSHTTCCICL